MVKSVLTKRKGLLFSETTWHTIIEHTVLAAKLDEKEKYKITSCPVAKLIAALPYYAGCRNPDQLAVLKVGIYLAACRDPVLFSHRKNQSVRERILPITVCPDGDSRVIKLVTDFLELISLNDHLADIDKDLKTGHPNPLIDNVFYYYTRREQLIQKIKSYSDQTLVWHLSLLADPYTLAWW